MDTYPRPTTQRCCTIRSTPGDGAERTDTVIERAAIKLALEQPTYGQVRVSNDLKKLAISVLPAVVSIVRHVTEHADHRGSASAASSSFPISRPRLSLGMTDWPYADISSKRCAGHSG